MDDFSPPSSWYDPPDVREHTDYGCAACCQPDEDGNIEPGCSSCHDFDQGMVGECDLCTMLAEEWAEEAQAETQEAA
jgi:cytochrome c551/c552